MAMYVPDPKCVRAMRFIRKMRGGSQAHLVEADDGHCYVVKFLNNPQHRRILINEWVAAGLLNYLRFSTPNVAVVEISADFLAEYPEVYLQYGTHRRAVEPGQHLGSRFPEHPDRVAVYDFLPDSLMHKVENRRELLGMVAFDKWCSNVDTRQAVFLRARIREWVAESDRHPSAVGFVVQMIDHGNIFNGAHWEFLDTTPTGLYFRPHVYADLTCWTELSPWLERIENLPQEILAEVVRSIPPLWLAEDARALAQLCERLDRRRQRLRSYLADVFRETSLFPSWAGQKA